MRPCLKRRVRGEAETQRERDRQKWRDRHTERWRDRKTIRYAYTERKTKRHRDT